MKLSAAARKALDALPPKRRAFVLAYCGEAAGNATEAARIAKYAHPGEEGYRLLRNAQVAAAIELVGTPLASKAIASIDEMQEMLSRTLRGEEEEAIKTLAGVMVSPPRMRDRLKALELLGKMRGAFIERREVSGPSGGPVVFGTIEEARRWAGEEDGE